MNKKIRNILIVLFSLLLMAGANIWLKQYIANSASKTAEESNVGEYICNYSVEIVEKIEIENEYGKISLVQQNDEWHVQGKEDVELDQEVVAEMAYMLTHIMSERTVSETEDTEDMYGMQNPNAVITTYYEGMNEQHVIIGDSVPIENEYYLQSSVFKKVYTVDMAYYIYGTVKLEDLLLIKGVDIEHGDMKEIAVINSLGEEFTIRRTLAENNITLCYWEFYEPFTHDVDTAVMYGSEKHKGMITAIMELQGDKVIDIGEDKTANYGLDNPIFSAEILSASGYVQGFDIGDYGNVEYYSLKLDGDSNIYIIAKDSVYFVDYSAFMLADANIDLINIDAANNVKIDLPGLKTEITIEHIKGEDTDINSIISIDTLDENAINAADIQLQKALFYEYVVTIKIDGLEIDELETGEKVGDIEFNLNSEYQIDYRIDFYEYSYTHYVAKKNGEDIAYLVNKREIEKLEERYNLLLLGELNDES